MIPSASLHRLDNFRKLRTRDSQQKNNYENKARTRPLRYCGYIVVNLLIFVPANHTAKKLHIMNIAAMDTMVRTARMSSA